MIHSVVKFIYSSAMLFILMAMPVFSQDNGLDGCIIDSLISKMTLEEKVGQLSGRSFDTEANQRLGIPGFHMTDGPIGVGQSHKNGRATAFPATVALAATWDTIYAFQMGQAIAMEAKAKGKNFLLAPCINIQRYPLGGRNFETFSEDPFLTSRMGVNFIKGVQSESIIACAKHFVANNQERNRINLNVRVSERALREIYFPAFMAAVTEAEVKSVMTSYNMVNGLYSGQNPWMINDVLKGEWGFDGVTLSDWESIYSAKHALHAGLDMDMPWARHYGDSLIAMVRSGEIPIELVNSSLRRVLGAKNWLAQQSIFTEADTTFTGTETNRELALQIARDAIVLLKNENKVLPVNLDETEKIALIGPNAAFARIPEKGSVRVTPPYLVSPYDAIAAEMRKENQLLFAKGTSLLDHPYVDKEVRFLTDQGEPGFFAKYYDNNTLLGNATAYRVDESLDFDWGNEAPFDTMGENSFSVRWESNITVEKSGYYSIDVSSAGGFKLWVDNQLKINQWFVWKPKDIQSIAIYLEEGQLYPLRLDFFESEWEAAVHLGVRCLEPDVLLAQAVETAKKADVAIVFVGLSDHYEQEGNDRFSFQLPHEQVQLIRAVTEVNPNTVVVINAGSAVDLTPFIDDVSAVLYAWYLGMETGNAIADVIFGMHNPGGKLPFTYPGCLNDIYAWNHYHESDTLAVYDDDIFVGYRYYDQFEIEPLFPFGFGLSYTRFTFDNLVVNQNDNYIDISFNVSNSGDCAGSEIAQLYTAMPDSEIERARKELKAFAKITIRPGETKTVTLRLDKDNLMYFDKTQSAWKLEPGIYEIMVGGSSVDLQLKSRVTLHSGQSR
jgi:beta-glucosidase